MSFLPRSSLVLGRRRALQQQQHPLHVVTSLRTLVTAQHKSLVSSMSTGTSSLNKPQTTPTSRLAQLTRQFATLTDTKEEYNMSSDNAQAHNNADFQLGEVFNVKDKVAVVTGISSTRPSIYIYTTPLTPPSSRCRHRHWSHGHASPRRQRRQGLRRRAHRGEAAARRRDVRQGHPWSDHPNHLRRDEEGGDCLALRPDLEKGEVCLHP